MKGEEKIPTEELFYKKIREALQTRESIIFTILQEVNVIYSKRKGYKTNKKRVGRIFQSNERIIVNVDKAGEFWMKEGTVTYYENIARTKIGALMIKILKAPELETND
ncbi:hypothetical protein K9N08_00105 [Candidatus Gracilibacteria bacterium]|nr:hypothetical protein [Candidatus Gracilibacteria bacterium]MCF7855952.1 hypothetical protein [Candidatus Gracilibacteria bacterium]MCF7896355.1 hypothetical protein [Candidatus Gracilibacteria bacterium]